MRLRYARTRGGGRARRLLALLPALATVLLFMPGVTGTALAGVPTVPATGIAITGPANGSSFATAGSLTVTGAETPGLVPGPATNAAVFMNIVSGPDSGIAQQSCALGAAANPNVPFTCTTVTLGSTAGQDQVRVYSDNAGTGAYVSGDPVAYITINVGAPYSITLTPSTASGATGGTLATTTCVGMDATLKDQVGHTLQGVGLTFTATSASAALLNPLGLWTGGGTFEALAPGLPCAAPNVAGAAGGAAGAWSNTGTATTDASGNANLGTTSLAQSTETIKVNVTGTPAVSATGTITWGAGGADGVKTLTVTPTAGSTQGTGGTANFTLTALNSAGTGVPNVSISYWVTAGPDMTTPKTIQNATCVGSVNMAGVPTTTANDGTCVVNLTATVASVSGGTDTFQFWVNQSTGGTAGPDPTEPTTTATWTWGKVVNPYDQVSLSCTDYNVTGTYPGGVNCLVPLTQTTDAQTATVLDTSQNPPGPVSGVVVDFTITTQTTSGATITLSSASCTTGSNGTCTVNLTDPSPANADQATVQARIEGAKSGVSTNPSSPQTTMWEQSAPSSVQFIDPVTGNPFPNGGNTSQIKAGTVKMTALVSDQFGTPAVGKSVNLDVTGGTRGNTLGTTCDGLLTNSAGLVTCSLTDTGSASADAQYDTVTAASTGYTSSTLNVYWYNSITPASVYLGDLPAASNVYPLGTAPYEFDFFVLNAQNDTLWGQPVALASSGVGQFVDSSGTVALGTSITTDITGSGGSETCSPLNLTCGEGEGWVQSTASGVQTITASAGGAMASGQFTWYPARATSIVVSPATQSATSGGQAQVTVTVTDRFGNGVPNICYPYQISGPASIIGALPPLPTGPGSWGNCGTGFNGISKASKPKVILQPTGVAQTGSNGTTQLTLASQNVGTTTLAASLGNAYQVVVVPIGAPSGVNVYCTTGVPIPASCDSSGTTTWHLAAPMMTRPITNIVTGPIFVQWGSVTGAVGYNVQVMSWGPKGGTASPSTLLTNTSGTSTTFNGKLGRTYCFRAAAVDTLGGISAYSGWKCSAVALDDRALNGSTGGWTRGTGKGYWQGTFKTSSKAGSRLTFSGAQFRRLFLIVKSFSGGGTVGVYLNGHLLRTVSTNSSGTVFRAQRWIATFGNLHSGNIMIKVLKGTVFIDGLGLNRL